MDDLAQRWQKLSLLVEEGNKVDLTAKKKVGEHVLAVKFLTLQNVNLEVVAHFSTTLENKRQLQEVDMCNGVWNLRGRCRSNMSGYLTYAIGVGNYPMMIRTIHSGYKAKNTNSQRVYTMIGKAVSQLLVEGPMVGQGRAEESPTIGSHSSEHAVLDFEEIIQDIDESINAYSNNSNLNLDLDKRFEDNEERMLLDVPVLVANLMQTDSEWRKDKMGSVTHCEVVSGCEFQVGWTSGEKEWLEKQPFSLELSTSLKTTRIELNCWLEKEDEMWRQRSRINWLQSGDRNTRFFHEKASARLKNILLTIISDTQSAFVHGRLITDNVLVAFEAMHHINKKKSGKVGEMELKLNMSKAFDRVEWVFLEKIM
uniref:Reverse transcriptase n=1 Tax=Quercus lobata TaxID=97700 RepID=A0A7N2KL55_QUELO